MLGPLPRSSSRRFSGPVTTAVAVIILNFHHTAPTTRSGYIFDLNYSHFEEPRCQSANK